MVAAATSRVDQLCHLLESLTCAEAADFLDRCQDHIDAMTSEAPPPKGNPGYVYQHVAQAAKALSGWKHAGERRRDTLRALAPLYFHASRWDERLYQVRQVLLDDDNTIEQFTEAVAMLHEVMLESYRLMTRDWPENPQMVRSQGD